jgi:hypothetical protein
MNKLQLEKEMTMLLKDLNKVDRRCKRISKACNIPDNHLFDYAVEQTKEVLEYIESLRGGE